VSADKLINVTMSKEEYYEYINFKAKKIQENIWEMKLEKLYIIFKIQRYI
jgi:hypothetical protein